MITKNILFVGLLMLTSLSAESKTLFALNNQYFSETMPKEKSEKPQDGQMIGARYDVGDVIVSTNLARWSTGVLGHLKDRNDGYFIVDIKNPLKKWNVSVNVRYGFMYSRCDIEDTSYSIRIGANNGASIYITTNACDVVIQNTQIKVRKEYSLNSSLTYFIKTKGEKITVMLNGQKLATLPRGEFDSLKTVEMGIGAPNYKTYSHLKNLTISQK